MGVIFESNMRFAAQIQKISTKCWGVLRYLYQLSTLHKTLKLYLVKALILSRIDYANTVLIGSNEADLKPLNAVSRAALRYVFSKRKFDSISKQFVIAHVLPVKYRITFCALTLIHRILREENLPQYLNGTVKLWKFNRIKRSALNGPLCQPEVYKNIYSRRRLCQFAKKCNNLSREIRETDIIDFSKRLKTILFDEYILTL